MARLPKVELPVSSPKCSDAAFAQLRGYWFPDRESAEQRMRARACSKKFAYLLAELTQATATLSTHNNELQGAFAL